MRCLCHHLLGDLCLLWQGDASLPEELAQIDGLPVQDLLSKSFRTQMLMDGQYGQISFVVCACSASAFAPVPAGHNICNALWSVSLSPAMSDRRQRQTTYLRQR